MISITILLFLAGLLVLTVGAEILLRGASKIAAMLHIRPIVIGLTVVSIGTSLPELAIGIKSVNTSAEDIALANIAGTNLVNLLLILGLSAAIRPLPIHQKTVKIEVVVMIFVALLLLLLSLDGLLSKWDGAIMLALGIGYLIFIIRSSRHEHRSVLKQFDEEYVADKPNGGKKPWQLWSWNFTLLIGGIAATIYGADLLVDNAVIIARSFGMSEAIIGLTIIAIGTSAPELVTTMVATVKNDRDVAIGNLMGSSIMNIVLILSSTILVSYNGLKVGGELLWVDLPLVALVAILCYPIFKSGGQVSRKEGIFFVSLYVAFLAYAFLFRIQI